ncbi:MAG: SurA N-terminal domain-containing protein [Chitinophagaceae bacterium]|nr:SurA N-terminal domain-containing protein [Chitinophagaceae bacterium]
MALIGTIRNKLGPIIAIVIGLALAVFILETALNSNSNLLQGSRDVVGSIDGEKIRYQDFANRVEEGVQNYKLQSNQSNIDDNIIFSLRDQTWNQLITEQVNGEEYRKLGLKVTPEELKDMFFGNDPVPEIKQAFTNPQTGIFDPAAVKNYLQNLDQVAEGEQEGERRARWVAFEKAQKDNRVQTKYQNLITKAMYIPKWQAETDYNEKNTRATVQFVMIPYSTIVDTTIKVTDAELSAYLAKHKEKFKQEESRQLEYVIFPVKPSKEDTSRVIKDVNEIYASIAASPSDTNLIKANADKGLDKYYYSKEKIESPFAMDTLFKVPVGSLIGPYFENGAYRIAKLMDRREVPDSVKARHIFVRVEAGSDTTAGRKKIDSLFAALNSGVAFDSLAISSSDDQGTAPNGGDLGMITQGQTAKSFNDFLFFQGAQGETRLLKTEFGYHIVQILERRMVAPAVQVDFITRQLEASSETDKIIFEQATQFASASQNAEAFTKAAEEQRLNKQVAPSVQKNAFQLPGLNGAREVVKWAYQEKTGVVSPVFTLDDSYAVALLTGIKEEGTMSLEDARAQLEMAVRKEKKATEIITRLSADNALNTTLESIAAKEGQVTKNSGNVMFSNSYAENLGYEPAVIGTIFSLKENTVSRPIQGEQGVFVLNVQSIAKPAPVADYNSFSQQLLSTLQPRVQYGIAEVLKKSVKIEDNRYLFF